MDCDADILVLQVTDISMYILILRSTKMLMCFTIKHCTEIAFTTMNILYVRYTATGLPLTGVPAYYMPEKLTKTPKFRWPGIRVCPK